MNTNTPADSGIEAARADAVAARRKTWHHGHKDATTALVPEFLAFTKARGLTGDAEECLIAATTDADRAWLRDFIARWNRAELRAEVVARFMIGEALDGGAGSLILAGNSLAGFEVFVDGGVLPDGRDVAGFDGEFAAVEALEYAVAAVRSLVVDSVEA